MPHREPQWDAVLSARCHLPGGGRRWDSAALRAGERGAVGRGRGLRAGARRAADGDAPWMQLSAGRGEQQPDPPPLPLLRGRAAGSRFPHALRGCGRTRPRRRVPGAARGPRLPPSRGSGAASAPPHPAQPVPPRRPRARCIPPASPGHAATAGRRSERRRGCPGPARCSAPFSRCCSSAPRRAPVRQVSAAPGAGTAPRRVVRGAGAVRAAAELGVTGNWGLCAVGESREGRTDPRKFPVPAPDFQPRAGG